MPSLTEIRAALAERGALVAQITEMATRELSPEEAQAFSDLQAKVAELDARIGDIESHLASEEQPEEAPVASPMPEAQANGRALAESQIRLVKALENAERRGTGRKAPAFVRDLNDRGAARDKDLVLRGWALQSAGLATSEHRAAASRLGVDLVGKNGIAKLFNKAPRNAAEARAYEPEARAQSIGTNSAGGFLVPTTLSTTLEQQLLDYANVRSVAQVLRTATGNPLDLPVCNDTANKGEIIAENTAFNAQDFTFSKVSLNAYKYSAKLVLVSVELLQDSAIDLPAFLGQALGERIGRIQADHFTTGTGASQPQGIVTGSTKGVDAASPTALAVDDLLGLLHSVDRAYRTNGAWMVHDSILLAIRKLKDSQLRPIFTESYREGEPDRLLGYPVIVNNSMDSTIVATKKTVLFGDYSKFVIRDAQDINIIRMDERYGEYGQVAFTALSRSDSKVLVSAAIKHILH